MGTKIIKDLTQEHGIKIGDNLLISLSTRDKYEINGKEIGPFSSYGDAQIVVPLNSTIFKLMNIPAKHTHYIDNDGKVVSLDEYNKRWRAITEPFTDRDGIVSYPSFEIEMDCRRQQVYMQSFKKYITEPTIEKFPVTIKIDGEMVDTGSEFIESAISAGQLKFSTGNSWGLYRVFLSAIAMNEATLQFSALTGFKINIPSTGLSFATINKENVFYHLRETYSFIKNSDAVKLVATLEEAKKEESNVREIISNAIHRYFVLEKNERLSQDEIVRVIEKLFSVEKFLIHTEPKISTIKNYESAVKIVKSLRADLQFIIDERIHKKESK